MESWVRVANMDHVVNKMKFKLNRYLKKSSVVLWLLNFFFIMCIGIVTSKVSGEGYRNVELYIKDLLIYGPIGTIVAAPIVSFYVPIAYYIFLDVLVAEDYSLKKVLFYCFLNHALLILLNPLFLFTFINAPVFSFFLVSMCSVVFFIGWLFIKKRISQSTS